MGPQALPAGTAALLLALVTLAPSATAVEETPLVEMRDYDYEPRVAYVLPNSTLVFRNTGATVHTVTAQEGSATGAPRFDSGDVGPGGEYRFNASLGPGTYPMYCVHHGGVSVPGGPFTGMVGEIVILNPDGSLPPGAPAPGEQNDTEDNASQDGAEHVDRNVERPPETPGLGAAAVVAVLAGVGAARRLRSR